MPRVNVKSRTAQQEEKAIEQLQTLTGFTFSTDRTSRALPYAPSGRKFLSDGVWVAPAGSVYSGVVVEIQGWGKHTNGIGVRTDNEKLAIAQSNGWLYWASDYGSLKAMAPLLTSMIDRVLENRHASAVAAENFDNPMEG